MFEFKVPWGRFRVAETWNVATYVILILLVLLDNSSDYELTFGLKHGFASVIFGTVGATMLFAIRFTFAWLTYAMLVYVSALDVPEVWDLFPRLDFRAEKDKIEWAPIPLVARDSLRRGKLRELLSLRELRTFDQWFDSQKSLLLKSVQLLGDVFNGWFFGLLRLGTSMWRSRIWEAVQEESGLKK